MAGHPHRPYFVSWSAYGGGSRVECACGFEAVARNVAGASVLWALHVREAGS